MADKPKKNYANEHPKYKDDQVKPKKRLYKKFYKKNLQIKKRQIGLKKKK